MNVEDVRAFYLHLPHVSEGFPFDDNTLVFKVGSKMFGYAPLEREEPYLVLKCEPERAIQLREHYEAVEGAYHMNKKHWNGIYLNRDLGKDEILDLVQHSYDLVWSKISKREKEILLKSSEP